MKYTVININRAEDVPEIPEDVKVIGVDYTWKYYPNLFNVYFTRLDALIEFIAAGIDRYGIPMCADELNKDSNKNGRFHMLRNFIRYRKILYYAHEGDAVTVMRNVMAGNEYIETLSLNIQKKKPQQTLVQQNTIKQIITPARKSEIIHRMRNDVVQHTVQAESTPIVPVNTPLVSVILPHYNRAEIVKKSIESLVNQTYQKLEILIVDDCSDKNQFDELVEYLSSLNDDRVHLYRCNKNVGPYVCKNEMFKVVKGEYITMQDSDDTSASDRIEKQVSAMSNDKVSVCYVNTMRGRTKYHQCLAAAMYKKHVLSDIGFFDTIRYGADSEFNERARTYYGMIGVVTINEHLYFTRFSKDCLTSVYPHGTKDRNDYYAACLVYIHNTNNVKYHLRYPQEEKRRFYTPKSMISDTDGLTCIKIEYKLQTLFSQKKGISIIIPAYKADEFITECLESIHDQNIHDILNYEILIGIDACKKTRDKLEALDADLKRNVRVFYFTENNGPYVVRNSLSKHAKYDKLLFFDADDIMKKYMLYEIFSNYDTDIVRFRFQNFKHGNVPTEQLEFEKHHGHGVFAINKSTFLELNGFFSWKCGADSEFLGRTEYLKIESISLTKSLFFRRKHETALTVNSNTGHASDIRVQYKSLLDYKRKMKIWDLPKFKTAQHYELNVYNKIVK